MPAGIPTSAVEVVTPTSQMFNALATDFGFRTRFMGLYLSMCAQILNTTIGQGSPPVTAGNQTYARAVINNPLNYTATAILYFIHRTNISGANIWVDLSAGVVNLYCDATDAAILSQFATDWTSVAGS